MEVILKRDIPNLGYANDLVTVKPGYARNYLIPKGMASFATEGNKKAREEILRQKAYKEEKLRKEAETKAEALNGVKLKIGAKAGTSGKIFGSVNAVQIANALKEQYDYDIDRKKIEVDGDAIKELGSYEATVKLYKDIEAKIQFEVVGE
ncbi:MAG: 50S ribosomal protein L9 [Bacteroidales bacterium]|nr:50S ribosomal protein L9 [Bacteroidales bacterium]